MKIRTTYDPPPIPSRMHDWIAVDDDTYDGPPSPIGSGPTEEAAIADLMEQLETEADVRDDDEGRCSCPTRTCWETGEQLRSGRDSWCHVHGIDPDRAYDEMRDRQMEDF